jgi:hypothetical protein
MAPVITKSLAIRATPPLDLKQIMYIAISVLQDGYASTHRETEIDLRLAMERAYAPGSRVSVTRAVLLGSVKDGPPTTVISGSAAVSPSSNAAQMQPNLWYKG